MAFLQYSQCCTALGDAAVTCVALREGQVAMQLSEVPDVEGAERVPLAYIQDVAGAVGPRWMPHLQALVEGLPQHPWGSERYPIFVTSSNYGIDHLYAFSRDRDDRAPLDWCLPHEVIPRFRKQFGWGPQITILSHACVTGQLGLLLAERAVDRGLADAALVFSFDFLSPFVIGGFNALKILNGQMPSPYHDGEIGSIGLGEGAAVAVISATPSRYKIEKQALFNEMYHFTSNAPDGSGFESALSACLPEGTTPKLWVKGHGTGTLEAGSLEARAVAARLPGAPLISWKGSIGHTLGSCAVVELALAVESMRVGTAPGNVGGQAPYFSDSVQTDAFSLAPYEGALLLSNAFGGAHAAMWISHE